MPTGFLLNLCGFSVCSNPTVFLQSVQLYYPSKQLLCKPHTSLIPPPSLSWWHPFLFQRLIDWYEREPARMSCVGEGSGKRSRGIGREKFKQTLSWAQSQKWVQFHDPETMTWATTKSQTLNWLCHPSYFIEAMEANTRELPHSCTSQPTKLSAFVIYSQLPHWWLD